MEDKVMKLFNLLNQISVKGEDVMKMADALLLVDDIYKSIKEVNHGDSNEKRV